MLDHKRLSFLPNLRELLTATSTGSGASDTTVHMSFPLGECRDLVEEYLEVLSSFIDFRMTHVQMTDNAEKVSQDGRGNGSDFFLVLGLTLLCFILFRAIVGLVALFGWP